MDGLLSACKPHGSFLKRAAAGLLLALIGVVVQCSATAHHLLDTVPVSMALSAVWPHQKSDLAPDPLAIFGRLPNGVRYVLKENHTPSDRVSMHLYIQAGSLLEAASEQGAAHFLEHMLFNGTTHFAPGEMVKYFQRIGMQFGPDANAHTGFDQTVFDVILPKGDRASLAEAMVVLKDYAQGALLLPEEVAREKKVILSEMRSRDSSWFRTLKETMKFEMPELLISQRLPIGEQAVIEKMDAQLLRGFYDAWYRPERMVLVLVGDFHAADARQLISEQFSDLKPRGPRRDLPALGRMDHEGDQYFYHQEADAGATTVAIETLVQEIEPRDTSQSQLKELQQQLAIAIVQKRLDAILQQPETVLTSADMSAGYYLRQIKYAQIRAECKAVNWRQTLSVLDQALRQALQFGFTANELSIAKGDLQSQLMQEANERDTQESNAIARDIVASLSSGKVFQSPDQRLDRLGPAIEAVTLEQVNQAFIDVWQPPHRLVQVTGDAEFLKNISPEEQIALAYSASKQDPVPPPLNRERAVFPYLPVPAAPGVIIQRQKFAELGVEKVLFANGVSLLFKPTNFKSNQVLAALSFGHGRSSEPIEQPGLAQWTEAVVNESGLGTLDRMALEDALAGRWVSSQLQIQEDMFLFKGEAVTSELPLLLQLFYAAVKDPGYRQDAYRMVFRSLEQQAQRLPHSVDGMMTLRGQRFLSGGDSRFGIPDWKQLQLVTLDQIKQWYGEQLRHAPMELAVVGDFQPDVLVDLVARYFGSLPKRTDAQQRPTRSGPVFPSGQALRLTAQSDIPKALVVVAFPTEDYWDIRRTRRLAMVAELFTERLRRHVREKLGAAYSPYAYNLPYRGFSGYGLLQVHVQVDPDQAEVIVKEVRHIADELVAESAAADEFRRILDPTLTHIKDLRQNNTYWLNSVLKGAARHPEQLDWARTFEKDYAAITAEEIRALAVKYLDNGQAATIVIAPETVDKK
jgi:zinc protease